MPFSLTTYNEDIKQWGRTILAISKNNGAAAGITHRSNSPNKSSSLPKMKDKYRIQDGAINKVSITFPRTLVYTQKGAGKGIGGLKGSRWLNAKGESKSTKVSSLNKIGTGNRKAKDFINVALDGAQGVEKLADIAANSLGDAATANIRIS